ncbi:hypothetical protein [Streptomyces sp. NPDC048269]
MAEPRRPPGGGGAEKRNTVERAINRLKDVFLGTLTAASLVIWLRA